MDIWNMANFRYVEPIWYWYRLKVCWEYILIQCFAWDENERASERVRDVHFLPKSPFSFNKLHNTSTAKLHYRTRPGCLICIFQSPQPCWLCRWLWEPPEILGRLFTLNIWLALRWTLHFISVFFFTCRPSGPKCMFEWNFALVS